MHEDFQTGCAISFQAIIVAIFGGGFIACMAAAGGEPRWWLFGLAGFFAFGGLAYTILHSQTRAVWMAPNMPYPVTATLEPESESDYPNIDYYDLWQDALTIVDASIETRDRPGYSTTLLSAAEMWEQ